MALYSNGLGAFLSEWLSDIYKVELDTGWESKYLEGKGERNLLKTDDSSAFNPIFFGNKGIRRISQTPQKTLLAFSTGIPEF